MYSTTRGINRYSGRGRQGIAQYNLKVLQYNTQYMLKNVLLCNAQYFPKNVLQYNTQYNSYSTYYFSLGKIAK